VHRAAGLYQTFCGHPLRVRQQVARLVDIAPVGQHRAGGLNLDGQCAERVREHVVDLAGDAGALVEQIGAPVLGFQLLALR
jgi:hypothetical protein